MTVSTTSDNVMEAAHKSFAPSMTSSGYGSQTVSTLTLSSEDSVSLKSNEEHWENGTGKTTHIENLKQPSTDCDSHTAIEKTDFCDEEKENDSGALQDLDHCLVNDNGIDGNSSVVSISGNLEAKIQQIGGSPLHPVSPTTLSPKPFPPYTDQNEELVPDSEMKEVSADSTLDTDTDPYSVEAMEELEKLGVDDEEAVEELEKLGVEKDENVHTLSLEEPQWIQSNVSSTRSTEDTKQNSAHNHHGNALSAKESEFVNVTIASAAPIFQSEMHKLPTEKSTTPVNGGKKSNSKWRGSGVRPRPMSMVVSPQKDVVGRAWQEGNNYSSDDQLMGNHLFFYFICLSFLFSFY